MALKGNMPAMPKTQEQLDQEKSLAHRMNGKKVDIERVGDKIIIPEGMKLDEAQEWIHRMQITEEESIRIHELIETFPLDGAYALTKALSEIYGWVGLTPERGWWGTSPPTMVAMQIGIKNGEKETVHVPWGKILVPKVEGYLVTNFAVKEGRVIFLLAGEVKRKDLPDIMRIANLTRKHATQGSVYRGKAIKFAFPQGDQFNPSDATPDFFDTSSVKEEELVFPKDVRDSVAVNIFTPIEKTEDCRTHQIPLKRGVLLEGPFGVGKTLAAYVTAKKCVDNGWTFLYLTDTTKLPQAIHFAQQYQPAVVFAEDIDQVIDSADDRTEAINDILNTIDGVDTKGTEVMVILTSNSAEDIEKAMIRPGRLDAVISVCPPDAEAAASLIRLYGRSLVDEKEDLKEACEVLAGQIPAVIREVVERSKLAAIRRGAPGETLRLTGEDLKIAANGMKTHLELMKVKEVDMRSDIEKAATELGNKLSEAFQQPAASKPNGRTSPQA